ncbi:MAG: HEAT repeat domain-containing protein [Phycisphaerae bacterium]
MKRIALPLLLAALTAQIAAARIEKPAHPPADSYTLYGDVENVGLLAKLLDEPDPVVRQKAVTDLGETNNTAALSAIDAALADTHPGVRVAALRAKLNLVADPTGVLRELLKDANTTEPLTLEALRQVERRRLATLADATARRIEQDEASEAVIHQGIRTLTALQTAADPKRLTAMLRSDSARGRILAAQNARFVTEPGDALRKALGEAAGAEQTALRATAVTSLGILTGDANSAMLSQAWESSQPLLRRAAVRVWEHTGGGHVREALSDPSPMVRVAAIRAARSGKRSECVSALFERLTDEAPDAHTAAREALAAIGGDDVVRRSAKWLTDTPGEKKNRSRNLEAALWLLAELKADAALEKRIAMLGSLAIDSPLLAQTARGLGNTGSAAAAEALRKLLQKTIRQGRRYLSSPGPVPYSEEVTAEVIAALGRLEDAEAFELVTEAGQVKHVDSRLPHQAAVAAQVAPRLAGKARRDKLVAFLGGVIGDGHMGNQARFHAAISAGEMKATETTDALWQVLRKDRPSKAVIHAAGWAIQEITAKTPVLPEPVARQGQWIVRKSSR